MIIRKANIKELEEVVALIDGEFTKEGFGFVSRAQIETEINKGRVIIAVSGSNVVGCRVGVDVLWNLVVTKDERGKGVGKKLMEYRMPTTIRVKSDPVGHLSKEQLGKFTDPTEFYQKLGYVFWGRAFPKNFWSGDTKDGERIYYAKGKKAHIKVFRLKGTTLFE